MLENNITIIKYRLNDKHQFHVLDKFDEPDEVDRLSLMMEWSRAMEDHHGEAYKELWIKNTPLI